MEATLKDAIFSATDQAFMARALHLAAKGWPGVAPNPMVGCVIVHQGRIIGEGYHQQYGHAHAEVNAVESVSDKSLLSLSTFYITLEPCAHHGKTPPCALLLSQIKPARVVVAMQDPFGQVNGAGIAMLQMAGIEVEVGLLAQEAKFLNRRFLANNQQQLPYITLKWAQTADGFIARSDYSSKWISNPQSRALAHKLRTQEQAILVGYQTALHDNPTLNSRDWLGPSPTRIVLDPQCQLPTNLQLFQQSNTSLIIVHSNPTLQSSANTLFVPLGDGFILHLLQALYAKGITSILVEGGSATLQKFINSGLFHQAFVFTSPTLFHMGIAAPSLLHLAKVSTSNVGYDSLTTYLSPLHTALLAP